MNEFLVKTIVTAALIILAMFTGTIAERRHFASIRKREALFQRLPAMPFEFGLDERPVAQSMLVMGSVCISIDYFKRFLYSLRKIFGGNVGAFESLIDRGRREAILRMKEQWPDADMIVNMRIETSSISQNRNKSNEGSVEVMAYGTAVKFQS